MKLSLIFSAVLFATGCGSAAATSNGHGPQHKSDGGLTLTPNSSGGVGCVMSDTIGCLGGSMNGPVTLNDGGSSSGNVGDDGSVESGSSSGSSSSSSGVVVVGDDGSVVVADSGSDDSSVVVVVGDDSSAVADVVVSDSGVVEDVVVVVDAGSPPVDAGSVEDAGQPSVDAGVDAPAPTCVRTRGYYATHPANWPVVPVTLGRTVYSELSCLNLLGMPTNGDDSLILADQLIAAIENGGYNDPFIASTITQAQGWLSTVGVDSANSVIVLPFNFHDDPSNPLSVAAVGLAAALDSWNSGHGDLPACQ